MGSAVHVAEATLSPPEGRRRVLFLPKDTGNLLQGKRSMTPPGGAFLPCGLRGTALGCLSRGSGNKSQMAGPGERALWEVAGLKLTSWCLAQEGLALRLQGMHRPWGGRGVNF